VDSGQLHEWAVTSLLVSHRAGLYELTKRNIPVPSENQSTIVVSNCFTDNLGFCKYSGLNKFLIWEIFSSIYMSNVIGIGYFHGSFVAHFPISFADE
jgi:hypothetical protein